MKTSARSCLAASLAVLLGAAVAPAQAAKPKAGVDIDPDTGITIRLADGRKAPKLVLDGRVHADYGQYADDANVLNDGFLLRRARPALALDWGDWKLKGEYEFSTRSKGVKQAWLDYSGFKRTSLRLGNQPVSFGFENTGSSNDNPFMERSAAVSALAPSLMLGLTLRKWDDRWNMTMGVFGNDISDDEQRGLDGRGVVVRLVGQPYKARRTRLHLGVSAEIRDAETAGTLRYRTRPESNIDGRRLVDTGIIGSVDGLVTMAVEGAWQRGPVLVSGEYLSSQVKRANGLDLDFSGWEVTGSWFVTGERRKYSEAMGAFDGVNPKRKWGAIELKARVSEVDLNDGVFVGGRQRAEAFGMNWWYTAKIRLLTEYVRIHAEPSVLAPVQDPTVIQSRLQVSF